MANFTGLWVDWTKLDERLSAAGGEEWPRFSLAKMTTLQKHGGSYSLMIYPGGYYDIAYGCDAGSVTIECYMMWDANATPKMEIWDGGDLIQRASPVGDGLTWEKVQGSFTAVKKVYTVRLVNYGRGRAYFDDVK